MNAAYLSWIDCEGHPFDLYEEDLTPLRREELDLSARILAAMRLIVNGEIVTRPPLLRLRGRPRKAI